MCERRGWWLTLLFPLPLFSHQQGYALIEYTTLEEARAAIDGAHDSKLLEQTVQVDFAFMRPPPGKAGRGGRAGAGGRRGRSRSRSPEAKDGAD